MRGLWHGRMQRSTTGGGGPPLAQAGAAAPGPGGRRRPPPAGLRRVSGDPPAGLRRGLWMAWGPSGGAPAGPAGALRRAALAAWRAALRPGGRPGRPWRAALRPVGRPWLPGGLRRWRPLRPSGERPRRASGGWPVRPGWPGAAGRCRRPSDERPRRTPEGPPTSALERPPPDGGGLLLPFDFLVLGGASLPVPCLTYCTSRSQLLVRA